MAAEHGGLIKNKERRESSLVKLKAFPTNVGRPNYVLRAFWGSQKKNKILHFDPHFSQNPVILRKILTGLSRKFWRTSWLKTPFSKRYAFGSWTVNRQIDHSNPNMCIVSTAEVNLTLILRMPVNYTPLFWSAVSDRRCARQRYFLSRCVSTL